jgi:hypothetical protein
VRQSTPTDPIRWEAFEFCSSQIDFGQSSRDTLPRGRLSLQNL